MKSEHADDEDDLFAALAGAVTPLRPAKARVTRPAPRRTPAAPPPPTRTAARSMPSHPVRDDSPVDSPSPWVLVRAGVSRERLRRLAHACPDRQLDLHGLNREQSLRLLQQQIDEAVHHGLRTLEIIHGRGLHSGGAPVLRTAVYNWLRDGPRSALVLAVIPKPDSGGGACLLLLRRRRKGQQAR